jgi:hypothetical protein
LTVFPSETQTSETVQASNVSGKARTVQYSTTTYALDIHVSTVGHAKSAPVFFYFLLLNVCDFNAVEIFLLEAERMGGGRENFYAYKKFRRKIRHYVKILECVP